MKFPTFGKYQRMQHVIIPRDWFYNFMDEFPLETIMYDKPTFFK
jgi:hypothetical protein